ncbi:hypothetical protein [Haloferula helveola]|uniref:hypothetical protein n=1 Tax=Haloferula helveola TaxID=490095 RepID=UPI0030D18721
MHRRRALAVALLGFLASPGHAQYIPDSVSTSTSYRNLNAAVGESGGRSTGATVTLDASVGGAITGGISSFTPSFVDDRGGFTGQLFDMKSINLYPSPSEVDEDQYFGYDGEINLDDLSLLEPSRDEFTWSVVSGPLSQVGDIFLLHAVFEDTPATVQAEYLFLTEQATFTIRNSDPDNYESYGGDGLDDAWQVQYFGAPPNADAAPTVDADHDGDTNEFEWLTDFDPTDGSSRFRFAITGADPANDTVTFNLNKVVPNRTYRILADWDLSGPFSEEVTSIVVGSEESDRSAQDTNATTARKFYKIQVTAP